MNSYTIAPDGRSITCHRCGLTSHHPRDVQERYCMRCGRFHEDSEGLTMWTVYDHPRDFPDCFVARKFTLDRPTPEVITADTLEQIRTQLSFWGLTPLARSPEDDPKIVETWI